VVIGPRPPVKATALAAARITTKRLPQAGFTKATKPPQCVAAAFPICTVALVFLVILVL